MSESTTSEARELALKFVYQCDTEKLYYFSDSHFSSFISFQSPSEEAKKIAKKICEGVFGDLDQIDEVLNENSTKWTVDRMPVTDRAVLRTAVYELRSMKTPTNVVLNEAIELAKKFGTENSGKFVNGLLDSISQKLRG
jgi:N utilization substance protein B